MRPFIEAADYLNVDPNMDVDFFIEGSFQTCLDKTEVYFILCLISMLMKCHICCILKLSFNSLSVAIESLAKLSIAFKNYCARIMLSNYK